MHLMPPRLAMKAPFYDRHLLIGLGVIGLLGVLALLLGNIIGSMVVPNHDWVADTVSDLAAGKYEIIQDIALYGYAISLVACAIGAAHLHRGGTRWNVGIACFALLALCVVIIGARNEYGDGDNEGIVIHIYIVYALGLFFAVLFATMAKNMSHISKGYGVLTRVCAVLWILGAPAFFMMPTGFDGLFERALGVVTAIWVSAFCWILISAGRSCD
jgi:hypothetical protein